MHCAPCKLKINIKIDLLSANQSEVICLVQIIKVNKCEIVEGLWSGSCLLQVCTRCLLKQKEDELSTQKALSAIEEARTGRGKCSTTF